MKLRELKTKDAQGMLEWMHDQDITQDLKTDFASKTLENCYDFIKCSAHTEKDLHLAIADDTDEYMGTVSLKHIDTSSGTAEFAITVRKKAMGKGYSQYGMREIIRIGFSRLGLQKIIWCVSPDNLRAVRFYEKMGYPGLKGENNLVQYYTSEERETFFWFCAESADISWR